MDRLNSNAALGRAEKYLLTALEPKAREWWANDEQAEDWRTFCTANNLDPDMVKLTPAMIIKAHWLRYSYTQGQTADHIRPPYPWTSQSLWAEYMAGLPEAIDFDWYKVNAVLRDWATPKNTEEVIQFTKSHENDISNWQLFLRTLWQALNRLTERHGLHAADLYDQGKQLWLQEAAERTKK